MNCPTSKAQVLLSSLGVAAGLGAYQEWAELSLHICLVELSRSNQIVINLTKLRGEFKELCTLLDLKFTEYPEKLCMPNAENIKK